MPEREYAEWPLYEGEDLELKVDEGGTHFALWSPEADAVAVNVYDSDTAPAPVCLLNMRQTEHGVWRASVPEELYGKFYTFAVTADGKRLAETPGIWAKAVGTNGKRAAVIDFARTNPDGWAQDRGPKTEHFTDAVIYEMHHRDFSAHRSSGIRHKGKFLALTEQGSVTPEGARTGISHLRELGVTHVHILPSFDFNSVDEAARRKRQYNWGYDPANYNVPEGSYSTNPANPVTRIREMKEMVKALHDAGIGVIMDVVYNHTAEGDTSNFSLTAPGYYYRYSDDGSYSNASGCGTETASERPQMRSFIVSSVKYWAKEYHLDGFRFDLMAIHDIATMNEAAAALKEINPYAIVYGEGWTAGASPLPARLRASKENVKFMNGVAVFSDDLRDAIKGHYSDEKDRGFVSGKPGNEETIKIGIVGATAHPQVDYDKGNKSKFAYAGAPVQIINYVSCHDNLCLADKLAKSMPGSAEAERQRAARLAQTIVLTSQGTPFIFAGEEIFRSKRGVANSYDSPDRVNAIDWSLKTKNAELFEYYRKLIRLRREHPAFRMTTAEEVARNIVFDNVEVDNVVSYSIKNHANGDEWSEVKLIFNGSDNPYEALVPRGEWSVIAEDGEIRLDMPRTFAGGKVDVAPVSSLIIAR